MPLGTLEVLLVEAKGLKNKDFLWKECDPEWNESFLFTVTDDVFELRLKIMDKDTFTKDDFVGEAIVPLEPLFADGRLPPTAYNVVKKDQEYRGEIIIGLTFTPEPQRSSF
ncbi:unnamed protein product [Malus baccata var. baccata]